MAVGGFAICYKLSVSILDFVRDRARYYNCQVCGSNLEGCGIKLLGREYDRYRLEITCPSCEVSFLLALQVLGLNTDDPEEVDPIPVEARDPRAERGPVTAEEVLEVHERLRDFAGPLTDLFAPTGGAGA